MTSETLSMRLPEPLDMLRANGFELLTAPLIQTLNDQTLMTFCVGVSEHPSIPIPFSHHSDEKSESGQRQE